MSAQEVTAVVPNWKDSGCTIAEARFAAEYCSNGFDAPKAYMKAVNPSVRQVHAVHLSAQLLNRPSVNACVLAYSNQMIGDKIQQAQAKIMDTLWNQAFYDIGDLLNPDGSPKFNTWEEVPPPLRAAVMSIKTKVYGKDADREVTEIELSDRRQAIKDLTNFIKVISEARLKEESAREETDEETDTSLKKVAKLFSEMQKKAQKQAKAKFDKAENAEAEVVPTTEV